MNEYKGEKVIEKLKARLVPSNDSYPDCWCEILLTGQHLYVLEDNFDGTYETHFTFPVRQIIKMETGEIAKLSGKPEEKDKALRKAFAAVTSTLNKKYPQYRRSRTVFSYTGGIQLLKN